jgi:hypothetical protein
MNALRVKEFIRRRKAVAEVDRDRRRFIAKAMITIACAELGTIGSSAAQSGKAKPAASSLFSVSGCTEVYNEQRCKRFVIARKNSHN